MKIADIIAIAQKKEQRDWADIDSFISEFDIPHYGNADYNKFSERCACSWVKHWVCTDTSVGLRVYFLDNEPICISMQPYRKSDESFIFLSADKAVALKEFTASCLPSVSYVTAADVGDEVDVSFYMEK